MTIIEPHIHMLSRTTDEYQAMYAAGIRACVEPSFWLGANRRHAGSFFDYFRLILDFETVRAARFGIDHFCAIAMNPKEADDRGLADAVIDGLGEYLDHPRCVALGEVGFNQITPNEEHALIRQLRIAEERRLPVVLHSPHVDKLRGTLRILEIIKAEGFTAERIDVDHNTEETIRHTLDSGCYAGMTVYPYSKLSPQRVSAMIHQYGHARVIVNGSADWGVSDPLALVKVVAFMRGDGHGEAVIQDLVFNTAMRFYSASPNWKPDFGIPPVDPSVYQR
ncbi:MAG: TatD family hydrolase [Verrucomicrobiota bacterium]|jgi:predicted metal-dependent TIM-barrel fold hydrolase|nr:TatD family hydrolase [Verrucomicrobiota bacterium]